MSDTLVVNEIYLSLQGESTFAGLPCIFIRLTPATCAARIATRPTPSPKAKRNTLAEILAEVEELAAAVFKSAIGNRQSAISSFRSSN